MMTAAAGRIELGNGSVATPRGLYGSVTVGAMMLFGAIDVAMHYLRSDLDPAINAQSRYLPGEWGFLMTIGFLLMGLGSLSLAIGIGRRIAGSSAARLGLTMIGAWSIAITASALVRVDPLGILGSLGGALTIAVSLVGYICAGVGAVALSVAFRLDEPWKSLHRLALLVGIGILAAIGLLVAASMAEDQAALFEISQRLVILAIALWMIVVGERLRTT
jgi:hypothetical protein